ncbi:MAG: hypothetical protein NTX64_05975, partial [Elusimicrobia bacterium]|nr:hypothetical protein [Elusimicrobiota bacterium]
MAVYNGKLYAGTAAGKVYVAADGITWSPTNGGSAVSPALIQALAVSNGKLYAGDSSGNLFATADGGNWIQANNGAPLGTSIAGLAAFNSALYAADSGNGKVYRVTPVASALAGTDGTTAAQTLTATGLNLASSTNAFTCAGASPCGATNQVLFTFSDMAGNIRAAGPYAIQVDALTAIAIPAPTYPANGTHLDFQPNFDWIGPSTNTIAGLPTGTSYYLQVSNNDQDFASGNIVISISVPAIVASTHVPTADAAYVSTFTLAANATYYWRIRTVNGLSGASGPWSQTSSFVTDFAGPAQSASFASIGLNSQSFGESQVNSLATGVGARIGIQDLLSGLAVSGNTFGVMYSTDAAASWIDAASISKPLVGGQPSSLAVYNGKLYAGIANGKVYVSPDGNAWSATNSGGAVGTGITALAVHKGKLYAGDAGGKIYVSADGDAWSPANGNAAVGSAITALAVHNGKLYAGDYSSGKVYVSADGSAWSGTNGGAPVGAGAYVQSLAVFNG